jgi:hypothetical protein
VVFLLIASLSFGLWPTVMINPLLRHRTFVPVCIHSRIQGWVIKSLR